MNETQLIEKVIKRKKFSNLPKKDLGIIFSKFNNLDLLDEDKIKLIRSFLGKVYGVYFSERVFSSSAENKDFTWFLKKHPSTRERLNSYKEVYKILLKENCKNETIFDLGCGLNGFSYSFFPRKVKYIGVEAIGQFVDIQNNFFKKKKINGRIFHESLFNLEKIKKLLKNEKGTKIVFLFKVLDSLEMVQKDYSKHFLKEISPFADKIVLSFATRSLRKKVKFKVNRKWIYNFVKENYNVLDSFELDGENYLVFSKK